MNKFHNFEFNKCGNGSYNIEFRKWKKCGYGNFYTDILHKMVFLKMIYLKDMEKYILKVNIHIVLNGKMK